MRVRELRAQVRTIAATTAFGAAVVFGSAILVFSRGMAQSNPLPERVRQPTPAKVVAEHMAAFNACDWKRLMAQFPDNVEFFAPNGVTVRGRKAVGEMFAKIVKPPAQGGTCGLKVTTEHTFVVGDVFNVQWRADAPFLAEPYRGADAYETKDGLMAAQVTTFDAAALKMKR
jgi:hypothetical protein